jgi:hypothetical protein
MSSRKKLHAPAREASPIESKRGSTENPLVFISHDSRDADLAEAFSNLLTDASGGILKSFRSSDKKGTAGIEYGQEWYRAIMQKLDDATDVVALLTARSLNRPWILYETGVAKGKLPRGASVLGIAVGVTLDEAATGPFAQFQNSSDDEDAITGLVLQLIRRHPQAAPREEAVRLQAKAFREAIAKLLKDRKNDGIPAHAKTEDTSVAKFFEEIKVLVRDVPERVVNEAGGVRIGRGRRRFRFHPGMMDEMFHHPMFTDLSPGLPVLMAVSLLRDDFPWLYELGAQFFRAAEGRNPSKAHQSGLLLIRTIELTHRGPFSEMMGIYTDEMMSYLHHVARMTERIMARFGSLQESEPPSKVAPKKTKKTEE